jgi:hypothetical protein
MLFETTLPGSDTATEGRNAVEELALPILSDCIVYRRRTACRIGSEFGSIGECLLSIYAIAGWADSRRVEWNIAIAEIE